MITMTLSLKPDVDIADLVERAKALPSLKRRVPTWQLRMASVDQGNVCYWCDATDVALMASHIISPHCGGTNASANVVAACQACIRRKGTADPLAWCQGSSVKLDRRRQALAASPNHPVIESVRSRSAVMRHLERRWEQPRFMVILTEGVVLWPKRHPIPSHVVVAVRGMGGVVEDIGGWRCADLRDRAAPAVGMLVGSNALLRLLPPCGGPALLANRAAVLRHQASPITALPS